MAVFLEIFCYVFISCLDYVNELLTILSENPNITVGENIAEDAENLEVDNSENYGCHNGIFIINNSVHTKRAVVGGAMSSYSTKC
jgi:hypothetical protein